MEELTLPKMPQELQTAKDLMRVFSPEAVEKLLQEYARAAVLLERERIKRLVLDDGWALTFQTFGQYRTALAKAIREGK